MSGGEKGGGETLPAGAVAEVTVSQRRARISKAPVHPPPLPFSSFAEELEAQQKRDGPGGAGAGAGGGGAAGDNLFSSSQGLSHSDAVLSSLKTQLLGVAKQLRSVLQTRTASMKQQAERRMQLGASSRALGRPVSLPTAAYTSGARAGGPSAATASAAAYTSSALAAGSLSGSAGGAGADAVVLSMGGEGAAGPAAGAAALANSRAARQQARFGAMGPSSSTMGSFSADVTSGGAAGGGSGGASSYSAAAFQQVEQSALLPEQAYLDARAEDMKHIEE